MNEIDEKTKIRVMIADDQLMVREGLKLLLSLDSGIEVVGMCQNGVECLKMIPTLEMDVVVMDLRMPEMDGILATKEIKLHYPKVKVMVLTTFNDDKSIFDALLNGASGFLLKDAGSEELIHAIKSIYSGGTYLHGDTATKVLQKIGSPNKSGVELTPREIEIGNLVSQGLSNKEVALKLYITEGTVKNHVSNILSKLGLGQRTQLVIYFRENGL